MTGDSHFIQNLRFFIYQYAHSGLRIDRVLTMKKLIVNFSVTYPLILYTLVSSHDFGLYAVWPLGNIPKRAIQLSYMTQHCSNQGRSLNTMVLSHWNFAQKSELAFAKIYVIDRHLLSLSLQEIVQHMIVFFSNKCHRNVLFQDAGPTWYCQGP